MPCVGCGVYPDGCFDSNLWCGFPIDWLPLSGLRLAGGIGLLQAALRGHKQTVRNERRASDGRALDGCDRTHTTAFLLSVFRKLEHFRPNIYRVIQNPFPQLWGAQQIFFWKGFSLVYIYGWNVAHADRFSVDVFLVNLVLSCVGSILISRDLSWDNSATRNERNNVI